VTVGLTKRLLDNKLSLSLNSSWLKGTRGTGHSTIHNNGLRADLQASKKHRFNALLNVINNNPTGNSISDTGNQRYSEFRGELGYNFIF
jgi:hypothetical protein